MRAIVLGSGIGGLTVAIALQRIGIDVTVYEKTPQLTEAGAGISLWANAFRALDHMGVGDAVRALSLPVRCSEFRVRNGNKISASFQAEPFEHRLGISPLVAIIHRRELVTALAGCLCAGTVYYGFECVSAETIGPRAVVRFKNGKADEADIVIGADGIRSIVRDELVGKSAPRYAGYTCWRGICPRPDSVARGYLAEWWGRGRRFGITTLPGDQVYWWATKNEPAVGHTIEERASVAEAFEQWADPVPELIATTPAPAVLRNAIWDRPPTLKWTSGHLVIIGDAAHPTTPNFGQGGCLAIEDAVVLARHLDSDKDIALGLASFVAERFQRTTNITNESWNFGRVGQLQGPISCWLRDSLLGLLLPLIGSRSLPKYAAFDVGPLRSPG